MGERSSVYEEGRERWAAWAYMRRGASQQHEGPNNDDDQLWISGAVCRKGRRRGLPALLFGQIIGFELYDIYAALLTSSSN